MNNYHEKVQSYIRYLCQNGNFAKIADYDYVGFWEGYIVKENKPDMCDNPIYRWENEKAVCFAIDLAKSILSRHDIKGTVLEVSPVLFFYEDDIGNIHYMRWECVEGLGDINKLLSQLKVINLELPVPASEVSFKSNGYEFKYCHSVYNNYILNSLTKINKENDYGD